MVIDSRALLDYALFQLTPTRTRCDLVIFAGKKNEKVASGLLEPFLSHLKSAKDEISKGGYSITLKPPSENSPWFTKATLERFVRFVSTPEVLERFVTIEREIDQIERSTEPNENGSVDVIQGSAPTSVAGAGQYKSKYESNGSIDAEAEENPKMRLQRVLESRKAMLKKEQAMAYARALVAGFEMDDIHDLASFSDVFGAHRLREACINFMELCNKKNDDRIWMDEVAAMQASYFGTPGIIIAGANTDLPQTGLAKSSTSESITGRGSLNTSEGTEPTDFNPQQNEGSAQTPIWHPHYVPPYMHNAQGPAFQQMPPYPGYIFPGMSGAPSHYPNALWPTNFHESGMYPDRDIKDSLRYKSSTKKREKPTNHVRPYSVSNGEGVEESDASSSGSNSGAEQEHESRHHSQERTHSKKLNRHSSKKVVIRNINYITSGRKEDSSSGSDSSSSGEDEYVDADSLKQQVEAAVVSVKRHQKPTSNKTKKGSRKSKVDLEVENDEMKGKNDGSWDIFQNLLMRDSDPISSEMDSKTIQVQEEYSVKKGMEEDTLSSRKFDKPTTYGSDDPVLTERSTGIRMEKTDIKFEGEQHFHGVVQRNSKDEELLTPVRVEGEYYLKNTHFGGESPIIKSQKEEDWILSSKQDASVGADHNIFQGDQSSKSTFHGSETKRDVILDDSFMVHSRLSDELPQNQPKADIFAVSDIIGTNEYDSNPKENVQGKLESNNYNEPEDLYMMLRSDSAPEQAVVATWSPEMDLGKDVSLVQTAEKEHKDKADESTLRGGNKTNIRNSKKQKAEVDKKVPKPRAPSGYLARSKSDVPLRSKTSAAGRSNAEKEEEKRKKMEELLLQRQKRIAERSAAKAATSKTMTRSLNESKDSTISTKSESITSRKPVMRSSTIDRLAAPRAARKEVPTESKTNQSRKPTSKGNSAKPAPPLKKTSGAPKKQKKVDPSDKNVSDATNKEMVSAGTVPSVPDESGNDEAALHKNETEDFGDVKVLHTVTSVEKREETNVISMEDVLNDQTSVQVSADNHSLLLDEPPQQVEKPVATDNHLADVPQVTVYPEIQNTMKSSETSVHKKWEEKRKISFSPQISVMNISTPPSDSEASPELNHSRKKWNNGEASPKVPKGFRKLLLFGRRT